MGHWQISKYAWTLALGLVLQVGCAETSSLNQVRGKVLVDGKPAEGASVLFFPQPAGEVSAGATDSNGEFTLVTNLEPGIAEGQYKITVTWPEPPKPNSKTSVMGDTRDPPDLLRGRYADPKRTPLSAEITSTTVELPPLELSTK